LGLIFYLTKALLQSSFKTAMADSLEQAMAGTRTNTGVSPLRRAMRLRGSGRDDVVFYGDVIFSSWRDSLW
jgi:hypothetical protein